MTGRLGEISLHAWALPKRRRISTGVSPSKTTSYQNFQFSFGQDWTTTNFQLWSFIFRPHILSLLFLTFKLQPPVFIKTKNLQPSQLPHFVPHLSNLHSSYSTLPLRTILFAVSPPLRTAPDYQQNRKVPPTWFFFP